MSRDAWRAVRWTISVELVTAGFGLLIFTAPGSGWYVAGRLMIAVGLLVAWRQLRAEEISRHHADVIARYRRSRS
ncbi:MAG TPA: hypothetical protein VMV41_14855 [Cellulomonadaceae bacterium]|nr:hypothetical protein [Cellulomonadaceae bacterium]